MTDKNLSELQLAAEVNLADLMHLRQGGIDRAAAVEQIRDKINENNDAFIFNLQDNTDPTKGATLVGYAGEGVSTALQRTLGIASPSKAAFARRLEEASHKGQKVVWVGDSITEQGKSGVGDGVGFTTFLQNKFAGATYVNEGIGGNTTLNIIARLSTLTAHNADLYVVAIGVNDIRYNDSRGATTVAAYIANIGTIYSSLSAVGDVMFIGVWPTFWEDQFAALLRKATDDRMTQYNNALRDFCRENSLPFSNPNPAIRSVIDFGNVDLMISDGVHPSYTGPQGLACKRLYADSVLFDNPNREDYCDNFYANGKVFFKFVFGNNGQADGFLGLRNIAINGTTFYESFGQTANLGYPFNPTLYGAFNGAYAGFYNKANDFPLVTTVGCEAWPDSIVLTALTSTTAGNRGARRFETWFSTDPESVTDINHPSWVLFEKSESVNGVAVNVLPKSKTRFYYQLRLLNPAFSTTKIKRIGTRYPVRVVTRNVGTASQQRFDLIFGAGAPTDAESLRVDTPNGVVMWESDGEENSIVLDSFDTTLGAFAIYRSADPNALSSLTHESWVPVITGSGNGTFVVPRMKPAEYLANSVATDVPGVVAALNTLMQRLRDAGIMKPSA